MIISKDVTTLIYQESEEATKHYLKEISTSDVLDFWSWREFSVRSILLCFDYQTFYSVSFLFCCYNRVILYVFSIFGGHFRLYSHKQRGAIELLYMHEIFFTGLRWFSIGSEKTIAQWTLFCSPEGNTLRSKFVFRC